MRYNLVCITLAILACPTAIEAQRPAAVDRIRGAMQLPATVDSVKKHGGLPESEVDAVVAEHRRRKIPASEARDVLVASDAAIREHGPVNNFGAFVQSKLASGLRGRALAQAIRQEHARRGIGKGKTRESMARGNDSVNRGRAKATSAKQAKNPVSKVGASKTNQKTATRSKATQSKGQSKTTPSKATQTKTKAKGRP